MTGIATEEEEEEKETTPPVTDDEDYSDIIDDDENNNNSESKKTEPKRKRNVHIPYERIRRIGSRAHLKLDEEVPKVEDYQGKDTKDDKGI